MHAKINFQTRKFQHSLQFFSAWIRAKTERDMSVVWLEKLISFSFSCFLKYRTLLSDRLDGQIPPKQKKNSLHGADLRHWQICSPRDFGSWFSPPSASINFPNREASIYFNGSNNFPSADFDPDRFNSFFLGGGLNKLGLGFFSRFSHLVLDRLALGVGLAGLNPANEINSNFEYILQAFLGNVF